MPSRYFESEQLEYEFYLTMLQGKQRNKLLGIVEETYDSLSTIDLWYKKIQNKIGPHSVANEQLDAIYRIMKDEL